MKQLIIFLFISTMLFAQVRTEQVNVKKIDENVVELRARLYGVFTDLKGKNKNQRTAYLNVNYKVGFLFENFRELGWDTPQKPMGDHAFREGTIDTLTIITTLTNVELNKDHFCEVYFKPKNQKYKFRLDGTEQIGARINDYLCEVNSVSIADRDVANRYDTITVVADVDIESTCNSVLSYSWQYRVYNDSLGYGEWLSWTNGRSGAISMTLNEVVFKVMSKNWDKRQWAVWVNSGVGSEKKSDNFTLRVNQ